MPAPALPARGFRDVVLSRHSLSVALPDAAGWQPIEPSEKWWAVRHASSRSELRMRAWTAPRRVSPAECERQARSWRPQIPVASPETIVQAHRLDAPRGFDTHVVVGVQALAPTQLEGYALAFGAGVGRCYAAIYETRAEGANAERAVGERLAVVVDGIFASVRLRSVDDRGPGPAPSR